jgi:acyl-CoA thioester hydrolase
MDNDSYGHVNNVVYYAWFDTTVNAFLIEQGVLDPNEGDVVGVVVETLCRYHDSVSFPEPVEAGLRVERIGTSSVRYEIGIFKVGAELASADGHFVHVYVDRETRRPVPVPDAVREVILPLTANQP